MVLKTCPICQARVSPVDCGERWCDLYGVTSTASSSARRVAPLCKKMPACVPCEWPVEVRRLVVPCVSEAGRTRLISASVQGSIAILQAAG